jgi:hypothetical protein
VNDYISRGGSGFQALKRNTSKQDTGIALRDALTVYLRNQAACPEGAIDLITDPTNPMPIADRYGTVSCLDNNIEAHDGRIRPVFE